MKLRIDLQSAKTDDEVTNHPARVMLESLLQRYKGKVIDITVTKIREQQLNHNKTPSDIGEKVRTVFGNLDKLRGYRPPKRKAEAASIIRMLKNYTPNQIITAWKILKRDKFWQNKELFLMTVETQIGAIINNKHTSKIDSYEKGKYVHMVVNRDA